MNKSLKTRNIHLPTCLGRKETKVLFVKKYFCSPEQKFLFFCSGEQNKNRNIFGKTFVPDNIIRIKTRSRKKLFLVLGNNSEKQFFSIFFFLLLFFFLSSFFWPVTSSEHR